MGSSNFVVSSMYGDKHQKERWNHERIWSFKSRFSSSHYPSMAMDSPEISFFTHYHLGSSSGYSDMSERLFMFGDCGGGVAGQIGHSLGSKQEVESVDSRVCQV